MDGLEALNIIKKNKGQAFCEAYEKPLSTIELDLLDYYNLKREYDFLRENYVELFEEYNKLIKKEGDNMAKKQILYRVFVCDDYKSQGVCVYESMKESNAEKFLHEYIRKHPNCVKAYIEKVFKSKYDKRNYDYNDED